MEEVMKTFLLLSFLLISFDSYAFCGFYVAKADTELFNEASKVVLVRDENKTVISMMSDYEGDLKNFAMVVPVPQILKKDQVNVGEKKLFSRIDSFTAPRLVEYFDENPCQPKREDIVIATSEPVPEESIASAPKKSALGVTIEEEYSIGEYDIVILSAKESKGLETWLRQNKYSIPEGASEALAPYIKQKMNFFVAKVNLEEQSKTGLNYLRPLQFAFESEKFMLPIRLGMINAKGPQELFVFVLTKKGRVETTNYPTVKLPSDKELPIFIKKDFANFYKDMFAAQVKKESMKVVFTEYFWDMSWCDPCAADPLSTEELRGLGVFWLSEDGEVISSSRRWRGMAQPVKVTRLHIRYSKKTFPEDLMFHQTEDTKNFQARYILRHPWKGSPNKCKEAKSYFKALRERQSKSASQLAHLTNWDINEIRKKMELIKGIEDHSSDRKWWENLWKKPKDSNEKNPGTQGKKLKKWWNDLWK